MVARLIVPLGASAHAGGLSVSLVCRWKPGLGGLHPMVAKPGPAFVTQSVGALLACNPAFLARPLRLNFFALRCFSEDHGKGIREFQTKTTRIIVF
jgi:hypothetical protein